jgi:hypothetical protein
MNTHNLDIAELRSKAQAHLNAAQIYTDAANRLAALNEGSRSARTQPSRNGSLRRRVNNNGHDVQVQIVTNEAIKTILRQGKNARAYELSNHFGCTPEQINAIVHAKGSGLVVAHRGWIKEAEGDNSPIGAPLRMSRPA